STGALSVSAKRQKLGHCDGLCLTLRISFLHRRENFVPGCVTAWFDKFFPVNDVSFVDPELIRVFQSGEKVGELLVVFEEVTGKHVMSGCHRALMCLVSLTIRAGLGPGKTVRVIE